jgi:hypothetical protein
MVLLKRIDEVLKSMTVVEQAYSVALFGIAMQYLLNALSYFSLLPDIAGVNLDGVIKNTSYVIPGCLAIACTLYFEGVAGLKRIFKPYLVLRFNILYWLFASLILVPLLYIALFFDDLLYGRGWFNLHVTTLPTWEEIKHYAPLFIQVAVSDELFWLGFIYPRLIQGGYSPLKAALAIGLLWGLDYLPYIFSKFLIAIGLNAPNLLLGWFALTPLYVWLYHRTGSAIIVLVFNVFMQFLFTAIPVLPLATGSNNECAMANLMCFIFGLWLWKVAPGTKKRLEPLRLKPPRKRT